MKIVILLLLNKNVSSSIFELFSVYLIGNDSIELLIFFIILIVLAILLVSTCVKIVPQAHAFVIERLGVYKETWSVGLHFKIPFLDRVSRKVNLKEQVADRLNQTAKELYGIDNFTDMIGDETVATDPETLVEFLTEKGHPALGMDPMM